MGIVQKALIVVPCYNEARRLAPQAFIDATVEHPKLSFVFVDDGSTDDTLARLKDAHAAAPSAVAYLALERNSGKAEAVRRGVLHALTTDAELIGYWDADLATPLEYIARFAEVLERPATLLVFGSRVRLLGSRVERSALRHYIGRGFATLAATALRLPVYDTQCGAKLFRAGPIIAEAFSEEFELGWSFDVELFARLSSHAHRHHDFDLATQLIEFPLGQWKDAPGSKLTASHYPRIALEVIKMFAVARRR